MSVKPNFEQAKTIEDFGYQWLRFPNTHDDVKLFQDHFGEIFEVSDLEGCDVVDIGSGTGRVVQWIAAAGARKIIAVEPSSSMKLVKSNTKNIANIVEYRQVTGDKMNLDSEVDYVISLGVIHHIPDPEKTMKSAYNSLRRGGRCAIWVYGRDGQESFVYAITGLRWLLRNLPDWSIHSISYVIAIASYFFTFMSRYINFPLSGYFYNIFSNWTFERRLVCIFDQLKPSYARYYSQEEAVALLENAGFTEILTYHRHRYSWSLVGTRE